MQQADVVVVARGRNLGNLAFLKVRTSSRTSSSSRRRGRRRRSRRTGRGSPRG